MPIAIRYQFSQGFAVPAREAYLWCTNYSPKDHVLMRNDCAERQVIYLTDCTVILKDIFYTANGDIEKQKLVQLYPDRLSWISTHLSDPNKYSQFIYEVSAKGKKSSRLDFTALHLEHEKENITKEDAELLANKLCKADLNVWKFLAKAMEKEYNESKSDFRVVKA